MSEVLLNPTDTQSRVFELSSYFSPVTLAAKDIPGGVSIFIQFVPVDRTGGEAVPGQPFNVTQNGADLTLTQGNTITSLYGPGTFRLDATQAGSTVYLARGENP